MNANHYKNEEFKNSKLVVKDVHSVLLLATWKPFVFIAKEHSLDAWRDVAVGEIKNDPAIIQ